MFTNLQQVNVSMDSRLSIVNKIEVLKETIDWYKPQILPHDCGWMHTTINGIQHRIDILRKELRKIDNAEKEIDDSISEKS